MSVTISDDEYERLNELAEVGKLVEVRGDTENPALEDIWLAGQPVGKLIESTRKEVREIDSQDENPTPSADKEGSQNDETALERIADDEQENPAGIQMGPSVTRAAAIMRNWREWSNKAPKGRNIKDGLLNLVETATDESLAWRQIYRCCKKVEQLTKGKIVFTKHKKHGWMLIQPSSEGT